MGAPAMQNSNEAAGERPDPLVAVAFYRDEAHPRPASNKPIRWSELVPKLTTHDVRPNKLGGGAFSMVRLRDGATRSNAAVEEISGIVLDFDGGRDANEVAAHLERCSVEHTIASTHGHTAMRHKFRVTMPLSRPATPDEWPAVRRGAVALVGGGTDPACKDPSRLYFLPSCPPERAGDAFAGHCEGDLVDPDELIALDPQAKVVQLSSAARSRAQMVNAEVDHPPLDETPENIARVRSALDALDPDCAYDVWRDVCFGTLSTGWSCAVQLARGWSMGAADRFDEVAFDKLIASHHERPDGIGIGTLFHKAREAGWVDPAMMLVDEGDDEGEANALATHGTDEGGGKSIAPAGTGDAPGDLVNAEIFAGRVADRLRYVHSARKWMAWDGARWPWAERGEEAEIAKAIVRQIFTLSMTKAAKLGTDTPAGRRWVAHALRTLREGAIEAMLKLARSDARLAVGSVAELDADPDLLGVRNGVVNLRTGELLLANPDQLITRQAAASVVQAATCPTWLRFLDEVFEGDRDMIEFVQRAIGYTLTGSVTEEVLFFMHGHGNNGKSVFANTITAVLGDYALTAPASMLTARRDASGPRDDVARLAGARLINTNETQAGERLDDQLVKTLVSRERVAARFLYGAYFEFTPTGKIWIRGNHKPIVVGDDLGIWRRLLLVPFVRTFSAEEIDRELEAKLLAERDGILAWAIEGAVEWYRTGLRPPPAVTRASAAYRRESDVLGQFLDEECAVEPEAEIDQRVLYDEFRRWSASGGFRPMSKAQLTRRLVERGITEGRASRTAASPTGRRANTYRGLRLV